MSRGIGRSCGFLVVVSLLLIAARPAGAAGPGTVQEPRAGVNWWSMPDAAFVANYGKLATGTQDQQSRFAWMVFARVNQRVTWGPRKQEFSQWELWPSDQDTFTPDAPRFESVRKVRTRPHLRPIQQFRMFARHSRTLLAESTPFPQGGEEVTRNPLSYDYITGKKLNTLQGLAGYLGQAGNRISFPLGVVETKAFWVRGTLPGAYQVGGFSLTALHLMVKVQPTPNNPFVDNSPSWFWTTFEYKSNNGLAAAQKFITYPDVLPPGGAVGILNQAGLGNTPFVNYVSNGQQIQFSDAQHPTIVLGNTQLEWFFATPANQDPTTWTSWSSSCHSCHAQASGAVSGNGMNVFGFTAPVGPLTGNALPGAGYDPYDFVWALSQAQ